MSYFKALERSKNNKVAKYQPVRPNIAICIPTRGQLSVSFVTFVYTPLALFRQTWCNKVTILRSNPYSVALNRNLITEEALKEGADYILWLDDDMLFNGIDPNEALKKLVETDALIVSGLCREKTPPDFPYAMAEDRPYYSNEGLPQLMKEIDYSKVKDNVLDVYETGLACCLIKAEVFAKMQKPYFRWDDGIFGEDLYFMKKARELGYKVKVRTDVKLDHSGTFIIKHDGSLDQARAEQSIVRCGTR
jgi:hypothetical protein